MTEMKTCTKCGEAKPATTEFWNIDRSKKDGLMSNCKACKRMYEKTLDRKSRKAERNKSYRSEYTNKNADAIRLYKREYFQRNKEKAKEWRDSWRANNLQRARENRNRYHKDVTMQCPIKRLSHDVRRLLRDSLRRVSGTSKTNSVIVIGCDFDSLKTHIESQFLPGMTWENRSEWHIDHIVPLAAAKTEEDVIRLNHYTNLRPLWAIDNLKKGAKLDYII